MNIADIHELHYCGKKNGNTGKCPNIATRIVALRNRKDTTSTKEVLQYRCELHATTPTAKKVVVRSTPLDQSQILEETNRFLLGIIGLSIMSSWHAKKALEVKYIKPNTGGVMCQNSRKEWKFVYYKQIYKILP
jgi:hypothetical protein